MASRKLSLINQDHAPVQMSLLDLPGTSVRGLEESFFPKIVHDAAGFKEVLRRAEKLGLLGVDYEFKSYDRPTIMGIAVRDLACGVPFDRTLHRYIADAARSGIKLVAHSAYSADRPVFDCAEGFESPLEWWIDSLLTHWFENSHLTKTPGKDESDDSGALGLCDLWTATSLVTSVPNWKEHRGSACHGPCPKCDVFAYCAADSWGGLEVHIENKRRLLQRGFSWRTFENRSELAAALHKMEVRGVKIDRRFVANFSENLETLREGLFPAGDDGEPVPFNPRSSQQVEAWFKQRKIALKSNQKNDVRKALEVTAARFGFDSIEALEQAEDVPEALSVLHKLDQYKGSGKGGDAWFADKYFDKEGLVHPRFIYVGTSTGRLSSSRPNCFSGDTEVLTRNGWLSFEQAVVDQPEIAQYHKDSQTIDFVAPSKWLAVRSRENLLRLHSEHIDLLVTDDHRCLVRNRKTMAWRTAPASVYPADSIQYNAGTYEGGAGIGISDDELRYLIATQADGWIADEKGTVRFTFRKVRKIERMRALLSRVGWLHYERRYPNRDVTDFVVKEPRAGELVRRFYSEAKLFGPWLLDLTRTQLDVFIDEVYHWDGTSTRQNQYASKHRRNVDWVQIVETLSDRRGVVSPRTNMDGVPYFEFAKSKKSYTLTTNVKRDREYREWVYCCEVPSDVILVRRNGKVSVIHQCQNIPSRGWGALIKAAIVPHDPDFDIIDADLGQLELRDVLYQAGFDIRSIKGDALQFIVEQGGDRFDRAAQIAGGEARDIVKTVVYGGQYGEGLQIYTAADLMRPTTQREIAAGAIRLYTPQYVPWLTKAWEYGGGIVGFTGANLAERLFGDKSWESRKKALEIQDDLIFGGDLRIIREWQIKTLEEIESKGYVDLPNTQFLRLNGSPRDNAKVGLAFKGQGLGAVHAQATMLACIRENKTLPLLQVHDSLVYAVNRSWSDRKVREFIAPMFGETDVLPGFKAPGKVKRGRNYGGFDEKLNPGGLKLIWNSAKENVDGSRV